MTVNNMLQMHDVSSAKDEMAALLQRKSEQCKKLEGNISGMWFTTILVITITVVIIIVVNVRFTIIVILISVIVIIIVSIISGVFTLSASSSFTSLWLIIMIIINIIITSGWFIITNVHLQVFGSSSSLVTVCLQSSFIISSMVAIINIHH